MLAESHPIGKLETSQFKRLFRDCSLIIKISVTHPGLLYCRFSKKKKLYVNMKLFSSVTKNIQNTPVNSSYTQWKCMLRI